MTKNDDNDDDDDDADDGDVHSSSLAHLKPQMVKITTFSEIKMPDINTIDWLYLGALKI